MFLVGLIRYEVATVLTACGIETIKGGGANFGRYAIVATVLTACGIETFVITTFHESLGIVATVLTACGIETQ